MMIDFGVKIGKDCFLKQSNARQKAAANFHWQILIFIFYFSQSSIVKKLILVYELHLFYLTILMNNLFIQLQKL